MHRGRVAEKIGMIAQRKLKPVSCRLAEHAHLSSERSYDSDPEVSGGGCAKGQLGAEREGKKMFKVVHCSIL